VFGVGLPEALLIIMLIAIFLGANCLPELGRSLGEAMRKHRKKDDS
jgi:Sec-independent protein translocase protein TatA